MRSSMRSNDAAREANGLDVSRNRRIFETGYVAFWKPNTMSRLPFPSNST